MSLSYTYRTRPRILPRKRARRSSRFEKHSMSYTKGHELGANEGATEDNDEHYHRPRIQRPRWRTFPYSSGGLQTVGSQYRFSPSPLHPRTRRAGLRSAGRPVSSSKAGVSDTPDSRKRLRPSPITDCKWRSVTEIGRRAISTRPDFVEPAGIFLANTDTAPIFRSEAPGTEHDSRPGRRAADSPLKFAGISGN